ncbi:Maf-like protein [Shinella yambaruensis]|uniref:7-methyl-GTP pyrophosphatase n=1 Tax=Shinella yambaruensis TaxID=415996 RepID=A0ABQ5ZJC6_9HYPH|nr:MULTISPECIES: Maf-like protein [Shinella]CAI0340130.1 7-methyl-GTP pyrophosphatase [Rhizobiaceae bacterium]CAK7258515.1 7-methyl-GTP pyrophosphatase [Shinella sp. WSC3-e]MCJ8029458.1 Maf-like protein [Shinella yambaruensis]MCO5140994.1 Maf-like protein [Shinella sp.]MCU7983546.1 Maf-like protein [Shinella yambaruensis]
MTSLILASQSPFRRMLMDNAGLAFETEAADLDERAIETALAAGNPTPPEIAQALAIEKAVNVARRNPGALVIGSDQTLSLEGRVFHKPADMAEAKTHLQAMSGRTHSLNCGIALVRDGETLWSHISIAHLTMRPLSGDFIDRHLARVGPRVLASVGAYQLEGEGVQLFERIDGDYFTILGLPLLPLLAKLRDLGAIDA